MAAMAGAEHVYALARPWRDKTAEDMWHPVEALAAQAGVESRITLLAERDPIALGRADIVTNLGSVRPIDKDFIGALKRSAVISYMREAWEVRSDEIDLDACTACQIPLFATDEHHPDVGVFDSCGGLAAKLLYESGDEIFGSHIVVVSSDRFGPTIAKTLTALGATVEQISAGDLRTRLGHGLAPDSLVIADFIAEYWIIGRGGQIDPEHLARLLPHVRVIAYAGGVDAEALRACGIGCSPLTGCTPGRMGQTLAYLGPRPVGRLHAAGLKVGEVAARAIRSGLSGRQLAEWVCSHAPAVEMTWGRA
jgi:hypothetical protein